MGYQSGDEAFGGTGIPACLHQNVESVAIAVHCAPEPKLLARDHDHHVQLPCVVRLSLRSPDTLRYLAPKFSNPFPDCLITHNDASRRKQVFYIPQAKRKSMAGLNRVGKDRTLETVAFEALLGHLADHRYVLRPTRVMVNNLTMPV